MIIAERRLLIPGKQACIAGSCTCVLSEQTIRWNWACSCRDVIYYVKTNVFDAADLLINHH